MIVNYLSFLISTYVLVFSHFGIFSKFQSLYIACSAHINGREIFFSPRAYMREGGRAQNFSKSHSLYKGRVQSFSEFKSLYRKNSFEFQGFHRGADLEIFQSLKAYIEGESSEFFQVLSL